MRIKNKHLLFLICKLGYWRNKRNLTALNVVDNGQFYIYGVDRFHIASQSFNWYLTKELLEQRVREVSCRYYLPAKGNTIIDIGAGLGEECCIYASLVGPTGTVYSIEANPLVYKALQQAIALNAFRNIKLFNVAINSSREKVMIDDSPDSYLSSSLNNLNKGNVYEVDGFPLEDFCHTNGINVIDLLKVNIEGAERFLNTAFNHPELIIHNVAISCHDFRYDKEGNEFFKTKQLVTDFLRANGYETWAQETGTRYIDDWVYGKKSTT